MYFSLILAAPNLYFWFGASIKQENQFQSITPYFMAALGTSFMSLSGFNPFYRVTNSFKEMELTINIGVEFQFIDHDNLTNTLTDTCGKLQQKLHSAVIDMSWGGWSTLR